MISNDTVLHFLQQFEAAAEKEDFTLIEDMIHEQAFFRFNDGDFVGRAAVRGAFEATWKGAVNVKKLRFYLTDVVILSTDHSSAAATYTYHWEGLHEGKPFSIQGRGTRILVSVQGRLQIIHEHLSRFPTGALK